MRAAVISLSLTCAAAYLVLSIRPGADPPVRVDFARDIEPIFRSRCHTCHGEQEQSGQLRLDFRDVALAAGPKGRRIVPFDPAASELYRRVTGVSGGERMPLNGNLSASEIERIRLWIDQGAAWPAEADSDKGLARRWAFVPPRRPMPPRMRQGEWGTNPIDNFVLAGLKAADLEPSPRASKETLARRLSLDLIGLPPTPAETERFLADESPAAYARLVDRLLASPHYGERWGRIWLDAARYADSNGFEKDKPRQVWHYRDWVVDALNRDLPYDRFVVEQIAGDLLPRAGQPEQVATGFLRNSMINEEGGADLEQFRMEALFDRMDTLGKAVLGLTVQCAQCHDHKYDPISQREYYRMLAFLNSTRDSTLAVYSRTEERARLQVLASIRRIEDALRGRSPRWRERMAAWEASVTGRQPDWQPLDLQIELGSGETFVHLPDKSVLAQGFALTRSTLSPTADVRGGTMRAFRLEVLADPRLPLGGPGRSVLGTAALTEFTVEAASASAPGAWTALPLARATADVNPAPRRLNPFLFPDREDRELMVGPIGYAIDGSRTTAWTTDAGPGRRNVSRKAVFQLAEPLEADEPLLLKFNLVMEHGGWNANDNQTLNLGRFRLSATSQVHATADPLPTQVRRIVTAIPAAERSPGQQEAVFRYWRSTVPEWREENQRIEALWAQYPAGGSQLVVQANERQRATQVLERGEFLRPGEEVSPGVPEALHPLPALDRPPTRLDFARWLVDRRSPTAARSIVNRLWQGHFGTGLVESAEDLGAQSPPPSHPRLLDWLAVELMDNGWSLKHVHRLITASETYRQASRIRPELLARDPLNRLLARGARYRVDGEIVRDIALAASGLLRPEIGGPPIYPAAPVFLFKPPVSYGPKRWEVSEDSQRYRRSLYAFRYRSVPFPALEVFDTPSGTFSCVRRDRSTTPLQALVTLNETGFLESARELGRQILRQAGRNDTRRIDFAFRRVLAREPSAAERRELLAVLRQERRRFASGGLDPLVILGGEMGPAQPERKQRPAELAAWTVVARILLNLDETITRG